MTQLGDIYSKDILIKFLRKNINKVFEKNFEETENDNDKDKYDEEADYQKLVFPTFSIK